jgi:MerR family transcriptional regulator/heat shock protein HspR
VPPLPKRPLAFDDAHAPLNRGGPVAETLGVQPAFVRRLDTEAVVQPARSAGGQRRYSRDEIDRIDTVSTMAGAGMTLPGIKRILVLEAEVAALQDTIAQLRARLGEG